MASLALRDATAFAELISEAAGGLEDLGFRVWGLSGVASLRATLQQQLPRYRVIILDIDGVLLWGASALAGVAAALQQLRAAGKRIVFLTNTAAKSRRSCAEGLRRAGIDAAEEEVACNQHLLLLLLLLLQVITMAYAAAVYLREKHPEVSVAFGVGDPAMQQEFAAVGIQLLLAEDHQQQQQQQQSAAAATGLISANELDRRVGAVVVGWDREFNYRKMTFACLYLQQQQQHQQHQHQHQQEELLLPFIATNRDAHNMVDGLRYPTNGAQLAAIELVAERRAVCVGKESAWLAGWLLKHLKVNAEETLVVGDRLDTDIIFAANVGAPSLLVLTGCTTPQQLRDIDPRGPGAPTFVLPHLGQLALALSAS
ncbi:hypothetical protein Efla_001586 [Eimeria flavescens]